MNKTVLFISILFVINSYDASAQTDEPSNFTKRTGVFVLGGLNISGLTGDDVGDSDSRLSFALGLGIDYSFDKHWSLVPELIYSRQGFKSDIVALDEFLQPIPLEEGVVFSQDYLLLPIKIHYKPNDLFYVFAGPQFAVLVNESNNANDFEIDDSIGGAAPIYFSGVLGAGLNFTNGIGIRASYQFGLSRTFKDVSFNDDFLNIDETLKVKAYHSVFNLSLTYLFN